MSGYTLEIEAGTWAEITDSDGSVFHKAGGTVAYIEAPTQPVFTPLSPLVHRSSFGDDPWPFHSVADTDSIWCYAINTNAVISVTPVAEV